MIFDQVVCVVTSCNFTMASLIFLKIKTTQGSRPHTSVLFRKIMSNLKPFFSGRYEESTKGTFGGVLGRGSWVTLLEMQRKIKKINFRKVECDMIAYHCQLLKNT